MPVASPAIVLVAALALAIILGRFPDKANPVAASTWLTRVFSAQSRLAGVAAAVAGVLLAGFCCFASVMLARIVANSLPFMLMLIIPWKAANALKTALSALLVWSALSPLWDPAPRRGTLKAPSSRGPEREGPHRGPEGLPGSGFWARRAEEGDATLRSNWLRSTSATPRPCSAKPATQGEEESGSLRSTSALALSREAVAPLLLFTLFGVEAALAWAFAVAAVEAMPEEWAAMPRRIVAIAHYVPARIAALAACVAAPFVKVRARDAWAAVLEAPESGDVWHPEWVSAALERDPEPGGRLALWSVVVVVAGCLAAMAVPLAIR